MKKVLFYILCISSIHSFGQEYNSDEWKTFKGSKDTVKASEDSVAQGSLVRPEQDSSSKEVNLFASESDSLGFDPFNDLKSTGKRGTFRETKDARIDSIIQFQGTPQPPDPVQIDGYRVQIFISQKRQEALTTKAQFMQVYPEMRTYMEWSAPNHFVRVGNFRTKLGAMKFQQEVKGEYPVATVIDCKIELPRLE